MGEAFSRISSVVALADYRGGAQSWWSSVLLELGPGGAQSCWSSVMMELSPGELSPGGAQSGEDQSC